MPSGPLAWPPLSYSALPSSLIFRTQRKRNPRSSGTEKIGTLWRSRSSSEDVLSTSVRTLRFVSGKSRNNFNYCWTAIFQSIEFVKIHSNGVFATFFQTAGFIDHASRFKIISWDLKFSTYGVVAIKKVCLAKELYDFHFKGKLIFILWSKTWFIFKKYPNERAFVYMAAPFLF